MCLILHLECSSLKSSVALSREDQLIHFVESTLDQPIKELNKMIGKLMEESEVHLSELNAISINIGPGSYSALRSGMAIIKGLAYALNIPVIGLDSGLILAKTYFPKPVEGDSIVCLIESLKSEALVSIYNFRYELQTREFVEIEKKLSLQAYKKEGNKLIILSDNLVLLESYIIDYEHIKKLVELNAKALIHPAWEAYRQSRFIEIQKLLPIYFRDPNITKAKKNLTA